MRATAADFDFILALWNRIKPRQRLARRFGIDVGAQPEEVRRGDTVEALVTISSTREPGDVQAGLICTEEYDEQDSDSEGHLTRRTVSAVAHEEWLPVESSVGVQSVSFAVPLHAPFSYEGSCLSFKWEVAARLRRESRLDADARHDLSVLP